MQSDKHCSNAGSFFVPLSASVSFAQTSGTPTTKPPIVARKLALENSEDEQGDDFSHWMPKDEIGLRSKIATVVYNAITRDFIFRQGEIKPSNCAAD
jgi:hypothetical protein